MEDRKLISVLYGRDQTAAESMRSIIKERMPVEIQTVADLTSVMAEIERGGPHTDLLVLCHAGLESMGLDRALDLMETAVLLAKMRESKTGKPLRLAISANMESDLEILQAAALLGIGNVYPMGLRFSIQEKERALKDMLSGEGHIPRRIKGKLSRAAIKNDRKIVTYLTHGIPVDRQYTAAARMMSELPVAFNFAKSLQELINQLTDPEFNTDFVCIDVQYSPEDSGMTVTDVLNTLHNTIRCSRVRNIDGSYEPRTCGIMALIGESADPQVMKEALANPHTDHVVLKLEGSIEYEDLLPGWAALMEGRKEIPPQVKSWIKPKKKQISKAPRSSNITLTKREQEIYDLLKIKGGTNKHIARHLDLSESTVKLHISSVLKKLGCTNRTQLAMSRD